MPEQVLTAARRLLADTPAADLSVRELARAAGVSHAAPYRHFGDRAGFLAALAAHCFVEFIEQQRRAVEESAPGDRLLAVGRAYVDYAVAHPYAFALIFDPAVNTVVAPPPVLAPLIEAHTAVLVGAVADGVEAGRLPADVPVADLGAAMWSAAHGLAGLVSAGRIPSDRVPNVLAALVGTER